MVEETRRATGTIPSPGAAAEGSNDMSNTPIRDPSLARAAENKGRHPQHLPMAPALD